MPEGGLEAGVDAMTSGGALEGGLECEVEGEVKGGLDLVATGAWFEGACALFRSAQEHKQRGPPDDAQPYEHRYQERKQLSKLLGHLEAMTGSLNRDGKSEGGGALSTTDFVHMGRITAQYLLGMNYYDTEERGESDKVLDKLVSDELSTDKVARRPEIVCTAIAIFNQLGVVWTNREQPSKALEYLNRAFDIYETYPREGFDVTPRKHGGPNPANTGYALTTAALVMPPWAPEALFEPLLHVADRETERRRPVEAWKEGEEGGSQIPDPTTADTATQSGTNDSGRAQFERIHTHTLFYLAQVHGLLGAPDLSARYCQLTLQRQMSDDQVDKIEWATNAANLGQYYLNNSDYESAARCLSAATQQFPALAHFDPAKVDAMDEQTYRQYVRRADIFRGWGKYYIDILAASSAQRQANTATHVEGSTGTKLECFDVFYTVSLDGVATKPFVDYTAAKKAFKQGLLWLQKAIEVYVLDGHVSIHVEILQDKSQLYRYLATFDTDLNNCCKMYKRRIDMLQPVHDQLNPTHFLVLTRQLLFEIGEAYAHLLDLKIAIANGNVHEGAVSMAIDSDVVTNAPPAVLRKINALCVLTVTKFQLFLDSFNKDGQFPKTFDPDFLRPILLSLFHRGRAFGKFIAVNRTDRLQNIQRSLDEYTKLVGYADAHPEFTEMEAEVAVCKEMVTLLPLKMQRIQILAQQ